MYIPRKAFIKVLQQTNEKQKLNLIDEIPNLMPSLQILSKMQRTKLVQ